MNQTKLLRHTFRAQLRVRGFVAAGLTAGLIFAFGLITADFSAWWFDVMPWLRDSSSWVKAQNSWDLFIFVFLGLTVISYAQQLQMVLIDRHNGRVLLALSESELRAAEDPVENMGKRRAALISRRRVVESLLKADPTMYSLVTLSVCFAILGHPLAAAVLAAFVIATIILFPRMQRAFDKYRMPDETDEESGVLESDFAQDAEDSATAAAQLDTAPTDSRNQGERRARRVQNRLERAERNLNDAAERMFMIINRPLIRLKVGWPILTSAAVSVAAIAVLTIHDMGSSGELPERATLLILLLALAGRTCLLAAQNLEDLAFFASMLEGIEESEDGRERL